MKKLTGLLLILCGISFSTISFGAAAGNIAYRAAQAQAVPVLSGSMLIALALLLFVITFKAIKNNTSGTPLSFVAALITAAVISAGGSKLISDAYALTITPIDLSNPLGGTVVIPDGGGFFNVTNTSGVDLIIDNIVKPSICGSFPGNPNAVAGTECSANLMLGVAASCFIDCTVLDVSDYRLKHNVSYLTELKNGIKLYSFKYSWSDETYVGVMAQDLMHDAIYKHSVVLMENDYYGVDYRSLGLQMITLDQWIQSPENIFYTSGLKN